MPKTSAGLLVFRVQQGERQVFLVHPGGPFFAKKDEGAWTIPKGEVTTGEDLLATALREFQEETGFVVSGPFIPLGFVKQAGGKIVHAFIAQGDFDPEKLVSNTVQLEWPPRSGRQLTFPEVDRGAWFSIALAKEKINAGQRPLLERFEGVGPQT